VIAKVAGMPDFVLNIAKEKSKFMTKEKQNIKGEADFMINYNNTMKALRGIELELDESVNQKLPE